MSVEIFLAHLNFAGFLKTQGCMMGFQQQTRVRVRDAALQSALR